MKDIMLDKGQLDPLGLANKTPVSWLHEVCTRNNITPKYDLLQVEGVVHEPIFQYRLTLEHSGKTFEETGTGKSKKEAKHNAARAMLASLEIAPNVELDMGDQANLANTSNTSTVDDSIQIQGASEENELAGGNPVGILQELCMKMKYPPPTYGVHSEEGLPHERLFAMACTVGDQFVQVGKGKSKKLAKRHAAHLMAEYLRNMPLETSSSVVYDEDDDKIIERIQSSRSKRGRPNKPKQNKSDASENLIKQFQGMMGPIVLACDDPKFIPENPIEYVEDLGEEQNFKAMYVDFEEKSSSGQCQCIVQLTLEPPAVLLGEGDTPQEAQRNAAIDVAKFFTKIRMVKNQY